MIFYVVGLVTNTHVSHATPGALYAKSADRKSELCVMTTNATQGTNFQTFQDPRNRSQGINFAPTYVAWRAGIVNLFLLGS